MAHQKRKKKEKKEIKTNTIIIKLNQQTKAFVFERCHKNTTTKIRVAYGNSHLACEKIKGTITPLLRPKFFVFFASCLLLEIW